MPWLDVSPGHQHPWYWLCGTGAFLSHMRKDFDYLNHVSVDKYIFMFSMKNSARKISKRAVMFCHTILCSLTLKCFAFYKTFTIKNLSWHGPLTRNVKLRVEHAPGTPGTFSRHRGLAIPTCFRADSLVTCTITRGHLLKHKPLSFSMFNAYYQSYICVLLNYGKARLISVLLKRYGGTHKTTFVQQNMPDELRYQGKTNFITSDVNKQVYISQIQRLI